MTPKDLLTIRKPLFWKLAVIFMITSLAVISAVAGYLALTFPHGPRGGRDNMRRNMLFHVNNVADKIGSPPNLTRTAKIADRLALKICVDGPNISWSSALDTPSINSFAAQPQKDVLPDGVLMGHTEAGFYILLPRPPYRYLFIFPGSPDFSPPLLNVLLLIGLIAIILFMAYFGVSWLLKPLTQLVTGVGEITDGNLDYRVDVGHGHDEFRSLGGAFNQMTDKVRSMLKAKERLLVDVSHELRSPLARMKVALEMVPKSANQKSMSRAVSEMETMLSEILESERLKSSHGALSKAPFDLAKLGVEMGAAYKGHAPGLKVIRPKNFPLLNVDEAKVRMVLKNVIENSLKYSSEQKKAVELRYAHDDKAVMLSVKDFGIGIPAEDLALVFEPFYRVDKSRTKSTGGYGLGLSLCREIMQAHGGEISISSELGSGTEVTLYFPKN